MLKGVAILMLRQRVNQICGLKSIINGIHKPCDKEKICARKFLNIFVINCIVQITDFLPLSCFFTLISQPYGPLSY